MRRYADSFFRYWHIALAPIILIPLISLSLLALGTKTATVSARVWADPLSLREMGYDDPSLTPGQNMVNNLTQLLAVSSFDRLVTQHSSLYSRLAAKQPDPPGWAATDLRTNLTAVASGTNLVTMTYSGKNAAVAKQVLQTVLNLVPREMELFNHRHVNSKALKIVDPPAAAPSTTSKKTLLLRLGISVAVALFLSGGFVVLQTARDRSVRYADEVPDLLDLPVLGIVPFSRELSRQGKA